MIALSIAKATESNMKTPRPYNERDDVCKLKGLTP